MATQRVAYKGKRELTMAQFEALTELDDAVDYDITDYPNTSITNAQMAAALGYSMLFNNNEIFVCSDDGAYTKGHIYQIKVENGTKSWVDVTPEQTISDVVIKDDLANYVPRQSESENIYSQVLNENGEFAVSISDNGDVANFKVTKEDVTYNGESLLKSSTILSDEPYTLTEEEKSQICENIGSVKAQTCESGVVKAYVISGSNPNDVCRVDSSGLGLAIARFDSNGLISLRSDPSSDNHATRKSYVDNLFQSALDAIPDEHEKTQVYKHKIMLAISDSSYLAFVFFSTSGTAMTKSAFLPTEMTSRYMDLSARRQTAETSTGHGVIGHIGNLTSSSIEFIRYDGEKETITIDDSVTLADVVFEL